MDRRIRLEKVFWSTWVHMGMKLSLCQRLYAFHQLGRHPESSGLLKSLCSQSREVFKMSLKLTQQQQHKSTRRLCGDRSGWKQEQGLTEGKMVGRRQMMRDWDFILSVKMPLRPISFKF